MSRVCSTALLGTLTRAARTAPGTPAHLSGCFRVDSHCSALSVALLLPRRRPASLPPTPGTVVGENVMLQVATSDIIVGPTRLLFPRAPGGVGEAANFPYSLLGLGDIAIPGELCGQLAVHNSKSCFEKWSEICTAALC